MFILSIVAVLILGRLMIRCETTNAPLTFYLVSEHEIKGGRFINTTNYPNLGYIAPKPDLAITTLLAVYPTKQANHSIMIDAQGKATSVPAHPKPSVTIQLTADDGKQFSALTERAVGKKLLIMLGEKPLIAPEVRSPLQAPYVAIEHPNESEMRKIQDELKRLVR